MPAQNFELSRRFYQAIGCTLEWETPDLACFRNGTSRFLLQDVYMPEHARSFVMSLQVEDVDAGWKYVAAAAENFGIEVLPPEERPCGMRDFTLLDPTGVLWRVGQSLGS